MRLKLSRLAKVWKRSFSLLKQQTWLLAHIHVPLQEAEPVAGHQQSSVIPALKRAQPHDLELALAPPFGPEAHLVLLAAQSHLATGRFRGAGRFRGVGHNALQDGTLLPEMVMEEEEGFEEDTVTVEVAALGEISHGASAPMGEVEKAIGIGAMVVDGRGVSAGTV